MITRLSHAAAAAASAMAIVGLCLGQAAAAEMEQHSTQVVVGDLNLASADGHAAAEQRIARAAADVCGTVYGYDLAQRARVAACRRIAIEGADAQLGTMAGLARQSTQSAMTAAPKSDLH